jgi:RimJ/RimL family protein N-acetyltransferase
VIFEDPEVVKGLVHDGSDPEVRRRHAANWSSFGPDGNRDFWQECKTGLYVITDRSGTLAPPSEIMGVTGVYLEKENGKWAGELFYALGSQYHGKGVMSEACYPVVSHFRSVADADSLYAVYWQVLNPASGSILNKLGFRKDGNQSIIEEYNEETATGIRNFELWRLANSGSDSGERIVEEVAIKLGHLESESVSSRLEDLRDILHAISGKKQAIELESRVEDALEIGRNTPGLAMMKLHV